MYYKIFRPEKKTDDTRNQAPAIRKKEKLKECSLKLRDTSTYTQLAEISYTDAKLYLERLESLASEYIEEHANKKNTNLSGKSQLLFFAIIGTLYNICNGFAAGSAILTMFIGIPTWVMLVVGILISLICITLFLGIDLNDISDYLNIGFRESIQLLDIYVQQTNILKRLIPKIKDIIDKYNNKLITGDSLTDEELEDFGLHLILHQELIEKHNNLIQINELYLNATKKNSVIFLRRAFPITADLIFFSYGFFTGQAMAYIIGTSLFSTAMLLTSWQMILISVAAGLVALILYWASYRFYTENFVCRLLGLDLEKIKLLPQQEDNIETDPGLILTQAAANLRYLTAENLTNIAGLNLIDRLSLL